MDEIDTKIVSYLKEDSRMPFLQMAKLLHVSEGTIRKRVANLKKDSVIKRFTVQLSTTVGAIVGIETNPRIETKKIVNDLGQIGLHQIYEVTGRFDIICLIDTKNIEDMNVCLEKIRAIDGINHTETFTILKEN